MWRRAAILATLATIAFLVWRAELFTVARPGDRAQPLTVLAMPRDVRFDVLLPQVPAGVRRMRTGVRPQLVHYWAPWERHGAAQARALDSLRTTPVGSALDITVVCFDPFPSLARYVARQHLGVAVVLDHRRELARLLPCPSVPYTYVIDASGRIVVAQPGEVDWGSPETAEALDRLARSRERTTGHSVAVRSTPKPRAPRPLHAAARRRAVTGSRS